MAKLINQLTPKWLAALLLAIFVLTGCQSQQQDVVLTVQGLTMGTSYSVKWVSKDADTASIHVAIEQQLKDINQSMSTYIDSSELSQLNRSDSTEWSPVSSALFDVLSLSSSISRKTSGAFDVTVGPLVNLWGFGPDGRILHAPDDAQIQQALARIGATRFELNAQQQQVRKTEPQLYIDLSAVAKGYAVDSVASLLESKGISRYLVEIGGELRANGLKPGGKQWRIAVEAPDETTRAVQRIINVDNISIATSGDYRNYFEENGIRFSHTIDPATGRPISHTLASVTVLASSCAEADALATAFMVMGEKKGYEYAMKQGVHAFFISKTADGFVERMTPGFRKYLAQ